ncbi:MAG: type II toxin-antitoxin system HipA family toxin [Methylococcales bacterium]|nr:type II toxin-antitoxin system HipA family toxin [Methylococcales bacterium]
MTELRLPSFIDQLFVQYNQGEHTIDLGLLTHGTHHAFQYTQKALSISLTMKCRDDAYNHGAIHPIFSQNLPEGFIRRYIYEKLARYGKVNDMYFLALQGANGIGALDFDAGINLPNVEQITLAEILSWQAKEKLFPQLLERYYLRGILSGVQPKVMINAECQSRVAVQQQGLIVKTYDEEFPLLTVNEFVCMEAARRCQLAPPKTYLSENLESYVIERFDKVDGQRLAFEDFATLMGKQGDEKYNSSYESLLKAVRLYTGSVIQVEKAYKLIVFNCLIGNGDAHLKNFALQYTLGEKDIVLAPPYDITHTIIYDSIDNHMALSMKKSKTFPNKNVLIDLGIAAGINKPADIIDFIADNISDYLQQSEEIKLIDGLRASIESSLALARANRSLREDYRHLKKKKYN